MTIALAIALAGGGGLASLALARAPHGRGLATGLAMAIAAACLGLGLGLPSTDAATIGGIRLAASPTVRVLLVGWSASLLLLGLVSLGIGRRDVTAPGLVAMAGALAALAVDQPAVSFGALTATGAAAILVIGLPPDDGRPERTPRARRLDAALRLKAVDQGLVASLGTGILAMGLVGWARSPVGASASGAAVAVQDAAFQSAIDLAIVAMASLAAVRAGAIPGHLWAARLIGAVPPRSIPAVLPWGSTVFVIVAVGWTAATLGVAGATLDDLDRWLIVLVGLGGLVLASLAAAVHDDLEHVFGYWLVQTGGVALLAFTAPGAATVRAVADWGIATAVIASGFAGWLAVARWSFGETHRVSAIAGWARRSPVLGVALLVLLLAAIGLPGTALADARARLGDAALPGGPGFAIAIVAAAGSLIAFGRILAVGLRHPVGDVAAAAPERLGVLVGPPRGWSRGRSVIALAGRTAATAKANLALALALAIVVLSLVALALAITGTGPAGAG